MEYLCKKIENCFAGSQTYEYKLTVPGQALCARLSGWELRVNDGLRRPAFSADRDGVNVKGVLSGETVRVSYPQERWEREKKDFESWLEELDV